jgi:hypothetical protein
MARLPDIDETKLSSEQRLIYEQIMRARGHMRGPFAVWLRNAELCANTFKLQEIELVSAVGFYVMVAMTLNAFAVLVPAGQEALV